MNEAVSCQAARYRNIFRRTKTMKKAIALAMASVMAAGLLAGCGGSAANSTAASSEAASSEAASTSTEAATEAHTVNTTDPITLTISWWPARLHTRLPARHSLKNTPTSPLSALTVRGTAGRKLSPLPWLPAPLPT